MRDMSGVHEDEGGGEVEEPAEREGEGGCEWRGSVKGLGRVGEEEGAEEPWRGYSKVGMEELCGLGELEEDKSEA